MADNDISIKLTLAAEQFKNNLEKMLSAVDSAMAEIKNDTAAAGQAMKAAFDNLKVKPVADLKAEIDKLAVSYRVLQQGGASLQDLQRAKQALTQRTAELRAQMDGAVGAVRSVGAAVGQTGSTLGEAAHKMVAWGAAMVSLNQLSGVASNVIQTGAAFETLRARLGSVLGSTEAASEAFDRIKAMAASTPFEVRALTDSFIQLTSFGLQPSEAQMRAITDTAAALGGGTESLNRVTLSLGQAWAKGKLQGEEILQMAEAGVPVWDALSNATGKTTEQLQKMSERGELGRSTIVKLIDELGRMNQGASDAQMQTFAGAVSNAKDALDEFFDLIATSGVMDYLKAQIQAVLAEFSRMKESGELQAVAKSISDGMMDAAEAVKLIGSAVKAVVPVLVFLAEVWAVNKVMGFVSGLQKARAEMLTAATAAGTAATGIAGVGVAASVAERSVRMLGRALMIGFVVEAVEGVINLARSFLTASRQTDAAARSAEAAAVAHKKHSDAVKANQAAMEAARTVGVAYVHNFDAQAEVLERSKKENAALLEAINQRHRAEEAGLAIARANAEAYGTQADKLQVSNQATQQAVVKADEKLAALEKLTLQETLYLGVLVRHADEQNDESQSTRDAIKAQRDYVTSLADGLPAAREAAGVARARAIATRLAAETDGDQSAQLDELRMAYGEATVKVLELKAAQERGLATEAQVKAATEVQSIALARYKDALGDTAKAVEAGIAAQQRQNQLAQTAAGVAQTALDWELKIAEAKGDTAKAGELKARQQENEIAATQAQGEAEAALAARFAQKARLLQEQAIANNDNSAATREAIAAALAQAQTHALGAEKATLAAQGLRDLSAAQAEAARTAQELASKQAMLTGFAAGIDAVFGSVSKSLSETSTAASALFERMNAVGNAAGAVFLPAMERAGGTTSQFKTALDAALKSIQDTSLGLSGGGGLTSGFGRWADGVELQASRVKEAWARQGVAAEAMAAQIDAALSTANNGSLRSLSSLVSQSETARRSFSLLDDEDLAGLNRAIDTTKQRIKTIEDAVASARSALRGMADSAEEAILRSKGQVEEIVKRQYQSDLKRLEEQAAQGGNDAGARAEAERARKALAEKYAIDLAAARAETQRAKQEAAQNAADAQANAAIDAARKSAADQAIRNAAPVIDNSRNSATSAATVQTLRLQAPDGSTTDISGQMDVNAVLRTLQQAGLNVAKTS